MHTHTHKHVHTYTHTHTHARTHTHTHRHTHTHTHAHTQTHAHAHTHMYTHTLLYAYLCYISHSTQDTFIQTLEEMKQHMREMQAKQNQMSSLSKPSSRFWLGGVTSNVGAGIGTGREMRTESNATSMPFYNHDGNYNISTSDSVDRRSLKYLFFSMAMNVFMYVCT